LAELEERGIGSISRYRPSSPEEFWLTLIHPPLVTFSGPSEGTVDCELRQPSSKETPTKFKGTIKAEDERIRAEASPKEQVKPLKFSSNDSDVSAESIGTFVRKTL
jgi:hypothetical protein